MIDFDLVLKEIGYFGRYQLFLICAALWSMVPIACNLSGVVFLAYQAEHRCSVQGLDQIIEESNTSNQLKQLFIPKIDNSYSKCERFVYEFNGGQSNESFTERIKCSNRTKECLNATISAITNATKTADDCNGHYYYDRSVFKETITTEWNLVCQRESLSSLSTAIFCLGMLLGSVVGGNIADRYGRIRTMAVATALNAIVASCCSLSPNFLSFIIMRFIVGGSSIATLVAMSVYTVEIVGAPYRAMVGLQLGVWSGFGYMTLSILGYFFRHWRTLELSLGLLFLPFLFIAPFMPESPRLLFTQGKVDCAKEVCRKMAKRNGRTLNENVWERAEIDDCEKKHEDFSPLMLCMKPRMVLLLVVMTFQWFINSLVFFCLSFNVGSWAGNPFLNNALSGLVESIACILVVPFIHKFGRAKTVVIALVISGSLLIINEVLKFAFKDSTGIGTAEVVILLIAKFTISGSFNMLFLYTAELYPTHIRNTALGVTSAGARMASIIAPFLLQTQSKVPWILPVVLGLVCFLSAVMASRCPETNGMSMLCTMADAQHFYKMHRKMSKEYKLALNNNNKKKFVMPVDGVPKSAPLITEEISI
nr:organic cation transporter protein-like [Ciona intestinalis]|eukprot:XP_009857789.2 organic cation transporter protein-like [Ciona intestinalis]